MQISKAKFDEVMGDINAGLSIKVTAQNCRISERQVQRIKEATTWERWPYIVAKATHGYNTPEYKQYLKRRKLPLTPPAKPTGTYTVKASNAMPGVMQPTPKPPKKRSLLDRLLGRK